MDGGAWWAAVHGVTKSQTQLSDFTFHFHFHALERERATHSSVLVWRVPGTGEPGGLPSMGLHRVTHGESDLAVSAAWAIANSPLLSSSQSSYQHTKEYKHLPTKFLSAFSSHTFIPRSPKTH